MPYGARTFWEPEPGGLPSDLSGGTAPPYKRKEGDASDCYIFGLDPVVNFHCRPCWSLLRDFQGKEIGRHADVIEKVKALITRFGGNVTDVDEWGKRRFAYEIQKMKEGFYYFVHFEAESTVPGEVEQRIRIMDNVLRYLCVKQEA